LRSKADPTARPCLELSPKTTPKLYFERAVGDIVGIAETEEGPFVGTLLGQPPGTTLGAKLILGAMLGKIVGAVGSTVGLRVGIVHSC
jgi:hypothetical protein